MSKTGLKLDTREFQSAMRGYIRVSKRTLPEIVNKRAINVSFHAMRKTPTARAGRIERDLRKRVSVPGRKGRGRPPRAALIIASGSRHSGRSKPVPGLYGSQMSEAIDKLVKRRQRSRGYVKSGFFKSIRDIERRTPGRSKRKPRNVQEFKRMPGEGRAARTGLNPTAEVINYATDAVKIAGKPLQQALNADARDMRNFTAKRMQQDADKFAPRKVGRIARTTIVQRSALVSRQKSSGLTVNEFARQNNIGASTLRKWIRNARTAR